MPYFVNVRSYGSASFGDAETRERGGAASGKSGSPSKVAGAVGQVLGALSQRATMTALPRPDTPRWQRVSSIELGLLFEGGHPVLVDGTGSDRQCQDVT